MQLHATIGLSVAPAIASPAFAVAAILVAAIVAPVALPVAKAISCASRASQPRAVVETTAAVEAAAAAPGL